MTGVILRCPNCGTSTATPGECDACHEAKVRYYCTNHKPGRWLDAPACSQCGAKFGDLERPRERPVPFPPAARPPRKVAPPEPARPADPELSRPKPRPGPWSREEARRPFDPKPKESRPSPSLGDVRAEKMPELLEAIARAGRRPRSETYTSSDAPPTRGAPGGCLIRFVLLVMLLFMFLPLMLSLIGGSLLQMLESYYF
jgi:hypothetical protein